MDELKPISHKEFKEFMKGKGLKGRNNYALKDLRSKFGFKPRRALVVSLEDMEPNKFDSMTKAVKAIRVEEGVIRYARNNGRDFIKRFDGEAPSIKVFFIKWC